MILPDEETLRSAEGWMRQALELAHRAQVLGEVPIGAVVVRRGEIVGSGHNRVIVDNDPTAHAEMVALRAAAQQLGNYRLSDCDLYVTIEPCPMCAGAMVHGRIARLIYGAAEPRAGAAVSRFRLLDSPHLNHRLDMFGGVLAEEAARLIKGFFAARRSAAAAVDRSPDV